MRVLFTIIFLSFFLTKSFGQATLFSENFTDDSQGAVTGIEDGVSWTIDCPANADFCGVDAGQDRIEFENLDGTNSNGETATYTTSNIAISGYSSLTISISLAETGTLESDDCVTAFYSIDGVESSIGVSCDDNLPNLNVNLTNLSGTNLSLRITIRNNGSGEVLAVTSIIVNNAILPVEFSKFITKNKNNLSHLSFSTASETNNDYFTIERSDDGRTFDAIGEIKGAGNSTEEKHYEFTDENPLPGINYYRIKQTDFDGQYSYSEIRSVRHTGKGNVAISPRSTDGRLDISTEMESYDVEVYSSSGQEVARFNALAGHQTVNIEALQAGVYFVKVMSGTESETVRVVKY